MTVVVYVGEYIHPDALAVLQQSAEIVNTFDNIENIDGMIIRAHKVDADILRRAKNLKIIGKHGVGCDSIDLNAAKEYGVPVLNTPFANTNSVAELIVGLALTLCRHISYADAGCRNGEYSRIAPPQLTGIELTGKTLGLIGMGNIAQRTAEILQQGFQMKVVGYDPYIGSLTAKQMGFEKMENLWEVLVEADVVNVSVPLTDGTKHLISGDVFDAFRKNAILINAARGGIVNEKDLYTALKSGKLRAAACDVFEEEPPTGKNPLLTLPNFCATPHIGAATEEALYRVGMEVVTEVIKVLNGSQPKHRVV